MVYFLVILIALPVVFVVGFCGLSKYKNRRLSPDYFKTHYKTQDTVPVGKVGVFVSGLVVPATYDEKGRKFFYNMTYKIFDTIIPWPFRLFSYMDKGVALLDTVKYHEHEEFTPMHLADETGSDTDKDGVPYIDKYKNGEVEWVPPSKRIYLDHGYFLYKGRKAGYSSLTDKTLVKASLWYYGAIKQKKMPHWEGTFDVVDAAFNKIKENYKDVEARAECTLFYDDMKTKLWEMLDLGCETIVLASPMVIYSHFEEFNSSFYHSMEYIEEWENKHPGKKIKVIMAPPMGEFKPMRQAFLEMLKDRLDTLPKGSDVKVAVTVHGMPWDFFPWEAWLELAPAYRDKLHDEVRALLKSYKFGRTDTVICQDEFADPVWDKEKKYLSTNQAYWDGINDGYDYVVGLPIEFWCENSDTLFHHALKNFHGFDEYDVYDEIDYPDWSVPYTRIMNQGKTKVIYNGVPVGKYKNYVIDALYQSIDSVLAQGDMGGNKS
jgi:hypothetical protein